MKNDKTTTLHSAYLNTHYRIPALHLIVRANSRNPKLDAHMIQHACRSCTIITACNPKSKLLSKEANQIRNEHLLRDIELLKLPFELSKAEAIEINSWPVEDGFCIFDIDVSTVVRLARKYEQNAVLYMKLQESSRLLWI
jgi:hypothetical protein